MTSAISDDPLLLQTIAESSPTEVLSRRQFWTAQPRFLIVCGASALAFFLMAPYTYGGAKGFVLLTIFIHSLAVWSAFLTIKSIAKLAVETAILTVIEQRASELLRAFKAKQIPAPQIERLEEHVLPDNQSIPTPAMIRLFQHICKEAQDRKFESSVSVIQSYREEPLEDIFKLQNLQKIALWLGILGTFIGLMLAIHEGNLSNLQTMDNFAEIVRNMFDDLFVSFSASLAGLEVAVVLGFFLLLLRKKQEAYFELMEGSVITMLSLARNALNNDDFMAEFGQVSTAMNQLNESVSVQTTVLSNRLNDLQKQIIRQNEQIQSGLDKLVTTSSQFDGFLSGMSETQRRFIDDVRGVHDAVSLKNLGTTLQETIVRAGTHLSEAIKPNVGLVSSQLAEFNSSIASLNSTLDRQSREVTEGIRALENNVKEQAAGSASAVREIRSQFTDSMKKGAAGNPQTNKTDMQELSRSISILNRKLDDIRRSVGFRKPAFGERLSYLIDKLSSLAGKLIDRLYELLFAALRTVRRKRL